jgi:hypothetical protein
MTQPNPFGNANQQGAPQPQQPVDEFELMRRRLRQRGAVAGQERQKELTRQFAQLGTLPSGAAFDIRQRAAEAQQRAQSEALQDVNILQAQTQRAEREAEAQRGLQRELGQLGARTQLQATTIGAEAQLGTAEIGAGSAREVANIQGKFGKEAQIRSIAAAKENLAAQIASNENLANIDAATKTYLGDLDFKARMEELQVSDATARYLSEQSLNNQLAIATLESDLKNRNLDLQELLTTANLQSQELESKLNTYATWVNAIAPLKQAGFDDRFVRDLKENMGIDFEIPEIEEFEARTLEQIKIDIENERSGSRQVGTASIYNTPDITVRG